MTFAEKLLYLRTEKIIAIGQLFGVSLDSVSKIINEIKQKMNLQ